MIINKIIILIIIRASSERRIRASSERRMARPRMVTDYLGIEAVQTLQLFISRDVTSKMNIFRGRVVENEHFPWQESSKMSIVRGRGRRKLTFSVAGNILGKHFLPDGNCFRANY